MSFETQKYNVAIADKLVHSNNWWIYEPCDWITHWPLFPEIATQIKPTLYVPGEIFEISDCKKILDEDEVIAWRK